MLPMDLVTPLSATAQDLGWFPRCHPWDTALVLGPWCWTIFE